MSGGSNSARADDVVLTARPPNAPPESQRHPAEIENARLRAIIRRAQTDPRDSDAVAAILLEE